LLQVCVLVSMIHAVAALPAALQARQAVLAPRTATRATTPQQLLLETAPPPGFEWGYSTLDSTWEDALAPAPAPAAPAPASPTPSVVSWYDSGVRIRDDVVDDGLKSAPEILSTGFKNLMGQLKKGGEQPEVMDMDVPTACKFMADPTLDSVSVEDKVAFLAAKGVASFVITQSTCVAPEDNVQGHPELPAPASGAMDVPAACKFMADPTLDSVSVEDKVAFLAAKGIDSFVITQSTCVAPEDNVQGHPELPAPAAEETSAAATEWPLRGGSGGYHRMAGRTGLPKRAEPKEAAALAGKVVPTAGVSSWFDSGVRL